MKTATMAKKKGDKDKGARSWAERKGKFATVQLHKDLAQIAVTLASHEKLSVAELLEPLLRGPLMAKWRDFAQKIATESQSESE